MKITIGLILLLFFTLPVNAAAVSAKLTGERLKVINGRADGEYLIPNSFDTPVSLLNTNSWIPGTFSSSLSTLTLTSATGEVVSVPARLAGASYLQAAPFDSVTPPRVNAPICGETIPAGLVTVLDTSNVGFCIANKGFKFKSGTSIPPFTKYRPILKVNKNALISAFSSKPSGIYSGTVSGVLRYGFRYDGTTSSVSYPPTYRNIPVTFSVQIQYVPNYISSVTVTGTGHISPEYDTYQHTAKGRTGYKITAKGSFESGIRFKFTTKDNNDYTLKPSTKTEAPTIPYSIKCDGCVSGGLLVDKGTVVNPEVWSRIEKKGSSIPFKLNVFYENVSVDDVVDGVIYRDNFMLMLEVIL